MRELNNKEIINVSGGSMSYLIPGFFENPEGFSQEESVEWTRPENIPAANTCSLRSHTGMN